MANQININGVSFSCGNNTQVMTIGKDVYINGKKVDVGDIKSSILNIKVEGTIDELKCDGDVTCQNVSGNIRAGSYVECGDVGGNVTSGSYVECGNVVGNVKAGSYIEMNK